MHRWFSPAAQLTAYVFVDCLFVVLSVLWLVRCLIVEELRAEIAAARGKLKLNQPGHHISDIDPRDITTLQQLTLELQRVKQTTWTNRRSLTNQHRQRRTLRLAKEGLMHVLLLQGGGAEEAGGGESGVAVLKQSCELLLRGVMAARVEVEEVEGLLEQARVERERLGASGAGEEEKSGITSSQLDDVMQQLQQRDKESRAQLQNAEVEYKRSLTKLVSSENNARKLWLANSDTTALTRYEQSHQWSTIRQSMHTDAALATQLATIQDNTTAISAAFSAKLGGSGDGVLGDVLQLLGEWAESCRLNVSLQWERDRLWSAWVEAGYRSECEVEREREEALVQFKLYRDGWEEEKRRAEERNERMLGEAVKDALRLAEENALLRQQLIEARSRM